MAYIFRYLANIALQIKIWSLVVAWRCRGRNEHSYYIFNFITSTYD